MLKIPSNAGYPHLVYYIRNVSNRVLFNSKMDLQEGKGDLLLRLTAAVGNISREALMSPDLFSLGKC